MHYSNIKPEEYLAKKGIRYKKINGELNYRCPNGCDNDSREDEAHGYMNAETGLFQCKKCLASGGLIKFAENYGDTVGDIIKEKQLIQKPKKVLNPVIIDICHKNLKPDKRQYLNNRGITDEIIDKYKLGWGSFYGRNQMTIPVRNEDGEYFFKLRRDPDTDKTDKGEKYINYPAGNGAVLFGLETIANSQKVFICEGEFDCMLLHSKGLAAVSSTAGAGTFKDKWVEKFSHLKKVFIVYDHDKQGEEGARMVAKKLSVIKDLSIFIITLPEEIGEKSDVTDYFTKHNGTVEKLISLAKLFSKTDYLEEKVEEINVVDLVNPPKTYRCERDEHIWLFEKNKLQIERKSDQKMVFSDIFRSDYFWNIFDNQEKVRKAVVKAGIYFDRKTAEPAIADIFSELRTNWKLEAPEEIKAKKQKDRLAGLILNREITLDEVHKEASKIGIYPKEMLEITMSIIASAPLRNKPPLWIMVIGSPSSVKTEIVKLFELLNDSLVVFVDSMSENAFCSGFLPADGSEPNDLLPMLDGKCLIVKEYSTVFSMKDDTLKKILGDLTGIFDEIFTKHTATRGNVRYESLFSQVGCVTPSAINKHHRYMNQLGPRFLFYRVPELTEEAEKQGFDIAWSDTQGKDRKEILDNAKKITSSFLYQLAEKLKNIKLKNESDEIKRKINDLSKFMARARGIVLTKFTQFKNSRDKVISYYEVIDTQVEQPWRAFQQLRSLARYLALVRGKDEVTLEEIETIRKVAISSMPTDRARVLNLFQKYRELDSKTISEELGISVRSAQRLLKELLSLKILDKIREDQAKQVDGSFKFMHFPIAEFEDILLGKETQSPEIKEKEVKIVPEIEEIDVEKLF